MSDIVHTFTPNDNSLSERVRAYKRTQDDFNSINASMDHVDDKEWTDSLGEKEEVNRAYEIIQNSMKMAFDSIEISELTEAKDQGLMTDIEVNDFIQTKRREEMRERRASRQNSESTSHSQKQ